MQKADLCLEGGGLRGVAFIGALRVFEREGWSWQRIAGTSAGAIVGAFLACGLRAFEIETLLRSMDFARFLDWRFMRKAWDVYRHCGLCPGDAFEKWIRGIVGDVTMRETKIPLTVFACDTARSETVRIDAARFPRLTVAKAVRTSMSVPFLFRPVRLWDGPIKRVLVDGGMTSNYPIDCFDVHAREPRWPTIGLLLDEPAAAPHRISNIVDHGLALLSLSREAPQKSLTEHNRYRSVAIADGGVWWLDFKLSPEKVAVLIRNGEVGATRFLQRWHAAGGFEQYVSNFRAR